MKSVKYLEKVKENHGLKNDAALARFLNLKPNTISQYMSGSRVMDEETCLAVALALEISPLEVIMAAGIDRAERSGQRSLWEVFSMRGAVGKFASLTLAILFGVNLFLTPNDALAYEKTAETRSHALYYVKYHLE